MYSGKSNGEQQPEGAAQKELKQSGQQAAGAEKASSSGNTAGVDASANAASSPSAKPEPKIKPNMESKPDLSKKPEQERKKPAHKGVYVLPNLFTAGSMFSAFYGMIMAANGDYNMCAIAILLSALLDGMDGKVARLTNTASEFGVQLDSLADAIAFGATPAFMVYQWKLASMDRIGLAIAALFMVCGTLRLARFNIMTGTISKKFFIGLPIPAGGCALSCLVLFHQFMPEFLTPVLPMFTAVLTVCLAFLMVSRIRYFSFKEYGFLRSHPFSSLVAGVILLALLFTEPKLVGFSFFMIYLLSGPIYTTFLFKRRLRREQQPPAAGK